ncbi:DUF3052 domain-containing protein [Hyphobacterium marinum]|uniref:DUF3052 domain-containing protein n=1 Tax=Hyphobacterium marinum TaxID=3116574 RepID=A0ABU7LX50_9PROT|nr:DUF3052 domain-containing protein [Hyphobacterium sp. Y6023]MEE2566128.1 DUF3052 domain-containing protein [Hyphobacterium sp. Y6023]
MSESGYSGTPLMKKLGAKPGMAALYVNVPDTITPMHGWPDWGKLDRVSKPRKVGDGPYDYIHIFETERARLDAALPALKVALSQTGMIWVSWPKKTAKMETTLDGNIVRSLGLAAGLVDIKVCAVDETWSGLKFVIPVKDRR